MGKTLSHDLIMQAVSLAVNLCSGTRMCPRTQRVSHWETCILGQEMHCCMVNGKL